MALVTETQWHGNPRPRKTYAWCETAVDGKLTCDTTRVPYAEKDDPPSATSVTPGPASIVKVRLDGPFPQGTVVTWSFLGDVTAGTSGTYTVTQPDGEGPEEVAGKIAKQLNWVGGFSFFVSPDFREINVAATGSNTTLTVDTWTVS
jgi:hypothetical protein